MTFSYQLTPWVKRLLIANTVVFALTYVIGQGFVFDWFSFQPTKILFRPWTPFTYMFLHLDFWHLFMNMLGLFFFGPQLESKWGSSEFIRYYLVCGFGGAALSFLFLLFVSNPIVGASAAVYGVLLGFAMTWPNAPIYVWGIFPIKAKFLVGFFVVVSFISAFDGAGGGVAHFAHLGGFAAGFLYLKTDWRASQAIQGIGKAARAGRRFAIVPREEREEQEAATSGISREAEATEKTTLDAVDRVLDKISAEGMASLTEQEKQLLDQVSKKHRTN